MELICWFSASRWDQTFYGCLFLSHDKVQNVACNRSVSTLVCCRNAVSKVKSEESVINVGLKSITATMRDLWAQSKRCTRTIRMMDEEVCEIRCRQIHTHTHTWWRWQGECMILSNLSDHWIPTIMPSFTFHPLVLGHILNLHTKDMKENIRCSESYRLQHFLHNIL